MSASLRGHLGDLGVTGGAQLLLEKLSYVVARLVNGGRYNVERSLLGELDDVFAQVRLYRFNPNALKMVVESHLFGDHRLALYDSLRPILTGQVKNVLVRRVGILSEEDLTTGFDNVGLGLLQVFVEVGNRMCLGSTGPVAHLLPAVGSVACGDPCGVESTVKAVERLLNLGVAEGFGSLGLEFLRCRFQSRPLGCLVSVNVVVPAHPPLKGLGR